MDQRARTQPATFTLTAGPTGFRVALANLRKNWLTMLGLVVVWGAYGRRNSGSWSETLVTLGWVLGGVLLVVVLVHGLYGLSTVKLTRDELVVTRMFLRQRLPRTEVGEFVRGSAWTQGFSAVDGYYWFITDVRGERIAAVPHWLFPDNGFEDLAQALGVPARLVSGPEEERRLSPWWMKRLWLTGILTAVVLVVGVALVWWAVVSVQDWWHARAEGTAQGDFVARVEPQLTTSRYPHLKQSEYDVPTSPLSVSAHAETASDVRLRSTITLVGTDPELPAAEAIDLLDIQCAASGPGAEVTRSSVTYDSDDVIGYSRSVDLDCGADRTQLHDWIRWSEDNPADADTGNLAVTQAVGYDGDQVDLEVIARIPDTSDEAFRAAMEHVCGYPGADGLTFHVHDEDHTRSVDHVACGNIEGELAG